MSLLSRRVSAVVVMLRAARERASAQEKDGRGAPARRRRVGLIAACAAPVAAACALSLGPSAALADSCPNAQFRTGLSAGLPDCRAYELVSPADTNGATVNGRVHAGAVSADGQHVLYLTTVPFPGSLRGPAVNHYRSTRTASGWQTSDLSASRGDLSGIFAAEAILDAPADFSTPLFLMPYSLDPNDQDGDPFATCPLVQGQDCFDLYLRNADGSFSWISQNDQPKTTGADMAYAGESADQSHVLFQAQPALTPNGGQVAGWGLYDRSGGHTIPVGVKTDGSLTSACGSVIGAPPTQGFGVYVITGSAERSNAVSSNGSRVFFESPDPGASGDPSCSPTQGGTQPVEVYLRQANSTTTEISLSQKSGSVGTPAPDGATFQAATTDGSKVLFTSPDALTDDTSGPPPYLYEYAVGASGNPLTFIANGVSAGQAVLAVSSDLSYIYLVGGSPQVLSLWHNGVVTPIPGNHTLATGASHLEVTPDGTKLVFLDQDQQARAEVFLFDAGTAQTTCLSCSPGGAQAVGDSGFGETMGTLASREISNDGSRVFFQSPNPLLPQAAAGQQNVYEWENGAVHLISDGTGAYDSQLLGASATGNDVFFTTADALVAQDQTNGDTVVYDGRVGGGLAGPPQPPPCRGEACQGQPTAPPPAPIAATVIFVGPGNAIADNAPVALKVLRRVIRGDAIFFTVSVPVAGRITIGGRGLTNAGRSVGRAGTYRLRVALTPRARRSLAHSHKLKLAIHVAYAPTAGGPTSATFAMTVRER